MVNLETQLMHLVVAGCGHEGSGGSGGTGAPQGHAGGSGSCIFDGPSRGYHGGGGGGAGGAGSPAPGPIRELVDRGGAGAPCAAMPHLLLHPQWSTSASRCRISRQCIKNCVQVQLDPLDWMVVVVLDIQVVLMV
jgi:hypothetical protein